MISPLNFIIYVLLKKLIDIPVLIVLDNAIKKVHPFNLEQYQITRCRYSLKMSFLIHNALNFTEDFTLPNNSHFKLFLELIGKKPIDHAFFILVIELVEDNFALFYNKKGIWLIAFIVDHIASFVSDHLEMINKRPERWSREILKESNGLKENGIFEHFLQLYIIFKKWNMVEFGIHRI